MGRAVSVLAAAGAMWLILRVGFGMLRGLATPLPPPPPSGEMRRVKLRYRCPSCGMELRVDRAETEDPDPPRHCMDEMDLVPAEE